VDHDIASSSRSSAHSVPTGSLHCGAKEEHHEADKGTSAGSGRTQSTMPGNTGSAGPTEEADDALDLMIGAAAERIRTRAWELLLERVRLETDPSSHAHLWAAQGPMRPDRSWALQLVRLPALMSAARGLAVLGSGHAPSDRVNAGPHQIDNPTAIAESLLERSRSYELGELEWGEATLPPGALGQSLLQLAGPAGGGPGGTRDVTALDCGPAMAAFGGCDSADARDLSDGDIMRETANVS